MLFFSCLHIFYPWKHSSFKNSPCGSHCFECSLITYFYGIDYRKELVKELAVWVPFYNSFFHYFTHIDFWPLYDPWHLNYEEDDYIFKIMVKLFCGTKKGSLIFLTLCQLSVHNKLIYSYLGFWDVTSLSRKNLILSLKFWEFWFKLIRIFLFKFGIFGC